MSKERDLLESLLKNIELWKEVQTKSQTKQEPKVCPNKMRSGSCTLPDPLCGYPNCEK